jgi:hypothetical protein
MADPRYDGLVIHEKINGARRYENWVERRYADLARLLQKSPRREARAAIEDEMADCRRLVATNAVRIRNLIEEEREWLRTNDPVEFDRNAVVVGECVTLGNVCQEYFHTLLFSR